MRILPSSIKLIKKRPKISSQSQSDACDWIVNQYEMKSHECLRLLKELGGPISPGFGPFQVPQRLYKKIGEAKVEDKVKFLAMATEQIVKLFIPDPDVKGWNNQNLGNFLNILYERQLKGLKQCVANYHATTGKSSTERSLKRYFRKIRKIQKKHNYSPATWENLRRVVLTHLYRMDIIAADMKNQLKNKKKE